GGRNTIVPGTNLVAGWFWWKDKIVVGVVDLEKGELLREFQKVDDGDSKHAPLTGFAYPVDASITATPTGSEVAFELFGRNENLFAVWNVSSGKLVYGHLGYRGEPQTSPDNETASSEAGNDTHLPSSYSG